MNNTFYFLRILVVCYYFVDGLFYLNNPIVTIFI